MKTATGRCALIVGLGALVLSILAGLATPAPSEAGTVQVDSSRSQAGTGRGYGNSTGEWRSPSGRSPDWGAHDPWRDWSPHYPWPYHRYYYDAWWGGPAWPPRPPVWVPGRWVWNGWGWVWQPGYWW